MKSGSASNWHFFLNLTVIIILNLSFGYAVSAESDLLPVEESPDTFLEQDIQSEDVDFFLAGSWNISLSGGAGLGWNSASGFDKSLIYSGISPGLSFSQTPDFNAMILIQQQYLFEAAFTDDFDESTFRLGYTGLPGDFLQSISIGNMGINFSDSIGFSDYLYVPDGGSSSFGIYTRLEGNKSSHELLLRFDPASEMQKTWIGRDSITKISVDIGKYIRGKYFKITTPDASSVLYSEAAPDTEGAELYGERYYARLDSTEYSYNPSSGLIVLDEKAAGAMLLVSDSFTDLIYDPGIDSDYELKSVYDIQTLIPEEIWQTRAYLASSSDEFPASGEIPFSVIDSSGIVMLDTALYGTEAWEAGAYGGRELIFIIREASSGYALDDAVEGSIQVFVNSIETQDWSYEGGSIIFSAEPGENDLIEVRYRKNTGPEATGDLLAASVNSFSFSDDFEASINIGSRLNLSESYSVPGEQTASFGGISAGISLTKPNLSFEIDAGLKIWTPNSSGNLLIKSMGGDDYSVGINRNTIFPGALSDCLADRFLIGESDRGELLYKEYRVPSGFSDYVLLDYSTAEIGDAETYRPSESTSENRLPAGPYTASASSDGISEEVLVVDYELDGLNSWAAAQLPVSPGTDNIDLSGSTAVSFLWKAEGDVSNIEFYFEAGTLSEDLDSDGILDAEQNELSGGYIFNDIHSEAGTLVGGDVLKENNALLNSEDINKNGFLDSEKTEASVFAALGSTPESDWKRERIFLNESSAELSAAALSNCEFVRFTVLNSSSGQRAGRILLHDIRFESAGFTAADNSDYSPPDYTEIPEAFIPQAEKPSSVFISPTLAADESNSVLRIDWDSDWQLYTYFNPIPAEEYEKTVFYLYCHALTPSGSGQPALEISLTDSDGHGKKALIPVETSEGWNKIEIGSESVTVNGETSADSTVTTDAAAGNINKLSFEIKNASDGVVYIDEVYLAEPALYQTAGASAGLGLYSEEPLLSAGGVAFIGPSSLNNRAAVNERSFKYFADLSTEIFSAGISTELSWNHSFNGNDIISATHSFSLPIPGDLFKITDYFSAGSVFGGDFYKSNRLSVDSQVLSGDIAVFSAALAEDQLVRKWNSEIKLSTEPVSITASADFLIEDYPSSLFWDNYFNGWQLATAYAFNTGAEGLKQRKTVLRLSPSVSTKPVGINLDLETTSSISGDGQTLNAAETTVSAPVGFPIQGTDITAALTLIRAGEFVYQGSTGSFSADTAAMFSTFAGQKLLYSSIPVYELFQGGLGSEFFDSCSGAGIDTAELSNTARIDFSRNYSSRITDLFIPYSLDFGFERRIIKDYLESEDQLDFDLTSKTAAINLFGKAGAFPFFDFYFSDELNWDFEAQLNNILAEDFSRDYLFKSGISIFGNDEQIFSVDSAFYLPVNSEEIKSFKTEFLYLWNQYPQQLYEIPFISPEDNFMQVFTHEEKLTFNISETVSAEIRHSTSFIIPGRLTISAFILAGMEVVSVEESRSVLTGISAGISGNIIY